MKSELVTNSGEIQCLWGLFSEPRAKVYCLKLNFKISKLAYRMVKRNHNRKLRGKSIKVKYQRYRHPPALQPQSTPHRFLTSLNLSTTSAMALKIDYNCTWRICSHTTVCSLIASPPISIKSMIEERTVN